MLNMTLALTGKRRETISGFLREIADAIDSGYSWNIQSEDGSAIGALSGDAISYAIVGITDKGERVVFTDHYQSRSHCFSSCTGAAIAVANNKGIGVAPDGKEHKIVRFVVEDNEGNTIFHRSSELLVTIS